MNALATQIDDLDGQATLDDLTKIRLNGDWKMPLAEAQARHYSKSSNSGLFFGSGFTGYEALPSTIHRVRLDRGENAPVLMVAREWLIEDLYEVARLLCAWGVHEMNGEVAELDYVARQLMPYGLISATPRDREVIRAEFIANGARPEPDAVFSFEHFCTRTWWDSTELRFDAETGTLSIAPMMVG